MASKLFIHSQIDIYIYMGADAVHSDARRQVWHPAGAGRRVSGVHAWQPHHYSRKTMHYMLQYDILA